MNRLLMFIFITFALLACPSTVVATQVFGRSINQPSAPQIPVTGADTFSGCSGPIISQINPDYEQAVVEQTNEIRMQNGLSPLKRVEMLDNSARYHSADMSFTNYFSHDTLGHQDGKLVEKCDTWARIENYYTNWVALAENIAAGQRTPQMAMDGWMNSPDHRHNILSNNYSEIGVGYYEGRGEYRYYWDQNFGKRDRVYPIVIDGEKAKTSSRNVPIYLYGNFDVVRLRTNNGDWSDWMVFQNNLSWMLPEAPGEYTVTAEMKGKDGEASPSDTIVYAP